MQIPLCPDGQLRPADLLLSSWSRGRDTAVDVTVSHGWQLAEQADNVQRDRWRSFLRRKEDRKHAKCDEACKRADWAFIPLVMGTWGGMGPEGAVLFERLAKRGATWLEGDLRAARLEHCRLHVGLALQRAVWKTLANKDFL